MQTKGYYDVDIDVTKLMAEGGLSEIFMYQDLKQRKLFIESDIDQYSVSDVIKNIMQYNAEDKGIPVEERKPILLYIASNGGNVDSGFVLASIIENSVTPIYTIGMYAYSMGFLIYLAGHKRFAFKDSRFLMHDGSGCVYDSTGKMKDYLDFSNITEARTKEYILEHTSMSSEYYDSVYRKELWMLAGMAKEIGAVDYIVGVDCGLEEIV